MNQTSDMAAVTVAMDPPQIARQQSMSTCEWRSVSLRNDRGDETV